MKRRKISGPRSSEQRLSRHQPYDEADWVDWDHWQTVEELQEFMIGLADAPTPEGIAAADLSDENGKRDHIARQIHRHGLGIDG